MKRYLLILVYFVGCISIYSQELPEDIKIKYKAAKKDTEKGKIIYGYLDTLNLDINDNKGLMDYFHKENDLVGLDYVKLKLVIIQARRGDFTSALNQTLQLLSNFREREDDYGVMRATFEIGNVLWYTKDYEQTIEYSKRAIPGAKQYDDKYVLSNAYNNIGTSFEQWGKLDSGLIYAIQSVKYAEEFKSHFIEIYPLGTLAECYISIKEYNKAIPILKKALKYSIQYDHRFGVALCYGDYSRIYLETNRQDSARYYAYKAIDLASTIGYKDMVMTAYELLYKSYDKTDTRDSLYKYFKLFNREKEALVGIEKTKQVQSVKFKEQLQQQEEEQEKIIIQNKIRTYALLSGLGFFLIIGLILYRNNLQKQKANFLLQEKNEKIQSTLEKLKSTQSQLIQSEKMASLGELTAGIAHEIQNPLNFVNNFSEVNTELIKEIQDERNKTKDKRDEELENDLLKDISLNQEKINHHGKRAADIVKGMLQHSRSSSGTKEPTDINALTDEYLRLAYHGLRAKDKSFNATMNTDFDEKIGSINIIPQDIGRVILNLITNAFYVVNEKNNMGLEGYEPTVSVSTKKVNGKVEIRVKDNGSGIPQKILDKIFQPFFTTKPTGQGTGLGLSLSYDIIKAHDGELKVDSKEGIGTEFVIRLSL